MARDLVLDVSAYQPQAVNDWFWNKWKSRGIKGGIVKLSEGTEWHNGYGAGQIASTKRCGLAPSGYHFSNFVGNAGLAQAEARYAVSQANAMGLPKGSALVLDYEQHAGYRSTNTQACIAFCNIIKQAGFVPVFYSYSGLCSLWDYEAIYRATGAKLWVAAYPSYAGTMTPDYNYFPSISTHTDAWQFSDNANGEHVDISVDFTGVFTTEAKVTEAGHVDSLHFDGNTFTVSGWFGSDKAQGKNNAFVILTNKDERQEFGRVKVNLTDRPDVVKAYPDIPNATKSGFSASFKYDERMAGQVCTIVFRYTDDPMGNGNAVDYTEPLSFTQSQANLDNLSTVVYKDDLHVSGWFASDMSYGHSYTYAILLKDGHEVERQAIKVADRPDVAKAYPSLYGANNSGFSADFKYQSEYVGHKLQIVFRYTDDKAGNGHSVDYWFEPFNGPSMPALDGKHETTVLVHAFSAEKADNDFISLTFK